MQIDPDQMREAARRDRDYPDVADDRRLAHMQASAAPTPVTMAREHIGAVVRPAPGEAPETDRLRCIAAGVTLERTRLSARLRARISVLRASPILSEEVDGAVAALEQVLAELGG